MSRIVRQAAANGMAAYLGSIGGVPTLSAEQERSLAARVAQGDAAARDHMVRANLALVVHIAFSRPRRGLPMEDLVAEGNLGLVRAVEEQCERLAERLGRLDERESAVLQMRFGLGGGPTATLQAVGDRLGMSRESARLLEERALARLT